MTTSPSEKKAAQAINMLTIDTLKSENLILLECLSGSRAYGLATAQSDTDIKGVFYLPKSLFYGLQSDYVPQVSNASNDIVYYELGRYIELLLQNNPNMMELLATPEDKVHYRHPIMETFNPEWFISKLCKNTFAGFANSQIKKARGLNKKIVNPMSKEKKTILDFCSVLKDNRSVPLQQWLDDQPFTQRQIGLAVMPKATHIYVMYADNSRVSVSDSKSDSSANSNTDDNANSNNNNSGSLGFSGLIQKPFATQLKLSSIPKGLTPVGYLSFNEVGFSRYCRDYQDYWQWVADRNDARYESTINHGKQYDAKNMMHTIRLLQMALDIAETGQVIIERPNRDELLAIKAGESDYETLLMQAEQLNQQIDTAFASSYLPDVPKRDLIMPVLRQAREMLYG